MAMTDHGPEPAPGETVTEPGDDGQNDDQRVGAQGARGAARRLWQAADSLLAPSPVTLLVAALVAVVIVVASLSSDVRQCAPAAWETC
jgi:hypothetical protein